MTAEPQKSPTGSVLIVGLGNPGAAYADHRHNVGFRVVDTLARAYGLRFERQKHTQSRVVTGQICGVHAILAKPWTYMNLSGRAVRRLSREYNVRPEHILVVYDDLDLPLGRLRLRPDGSSGGHRGMLSIIEQLGTMGFPRLRVGIGRPRGMTDPADYVLEPFDDNEDVMVAEMVEMAMGAIESWISAGIAAAMDRFNRPLPTEDRDDTLSGLQRVMEACPEEEEGPSSQESDERCPEGHNKVHPEANQG